MQVGTPVRKPLGELPPRDFKSNVISPSRSNLGTPKTSPGPALLLALRLSAKKQIAKSAQLSTDEKENIVEESKADSGVARFRSLLSSETERITELCNKWDSLLSEPKSDENISSVPTDAILGDIRTTVGQGRLIMRERFHQFKGLVDNCEFGTGEKPVTCEDLQGFWDMIYFQVEDVNMKFDLLQKCKFSDWNEEILKTSTIVNTSKEQKKPIKKKRQTVTKAPSAASKARKEMLAAKRAEARKRLAAAKKGMKRAMQTDEYDNNGRMPIKEERVTFDAGFFKVDSPARSPIHKMPPVDGTPCGTSSRKQVYAPGSVTKSLQMSISNSPAVTAETQSSSQNEELVGESTSRNLFKRLEFVPEESGCDSECWVEILLSDSHVPVPDNEACSEVDDTNVMLNEDQCHPAMKSPNSKCSDVKQESDIKSVPEICDVALPPPPAFANSKGQVLKVGTDVESVCKESSNNSQNSFAKGQVFHFENSLESSTKHVTESVRQDENETSDLRDVTAENKNFETNRNLTFIVSECTVENVPAKTCNNAAIVKKLCRVSCEENQDSDASNMSILIDEAARNIEKASEILKDTPKREVDGNQEPKSFQATPAKDVTTPSVTTMGGHVRYDALMTTLREVACQMENLQKLNDIHLRTPSPMRQKQTMVKKMKEMQRQITDLKDENSHLKGLLVAEKDKASNVDLSDPEQVMKIFFDGQDDGLKVPDSCYKSHYYRLLGRVKLLHGELKAYDEVKSPLKELHGQLLETFKKLEKRTSEVEESSKMLKTWESTLKEREERDNKELLDCRKTIKSLQSQLSDVQADLDTCEMERQQSCTLTEVLRAANITGMKEKESLEQETAKLNQENFSMEEKCKALEEKFDMTTTMYDDERNRAEALEEKVKYLGEEIESVFSKFNANILQRDETISEQRRQIEDLNSAITKFRQDCKALHDRIETLEYVEDEMRSLQEQLAETEVILKDSEAKCTAKSSIIDERTKEIDSLNQQIKGKNLEVVDLQEELDVAKSEAHLMVQQREEELTYCKTVLDHILGKMSELNLTLRKKIVDDYPQGTQKVKEPDVLPSERLPSVENVEAAVDAEDSSLSTISDIQVHSSKSSNQDSIIQKVDDSAESIQSIIESFLELQTKFQKEINSVNLKNAVLQKQLASSKDKLSDLNKEENELERVLRKRIEKLSKENEEKSAKLDCNSRAMKMLSDQNMELTNYMMKYEKLTGNNRSTRSRSSKRRSSSAGSLKFLP